MSLANLFSWSRYRNKSVEIIHVETPADATRSHVHPGLGSRPMHACSCSKVIAAFAEDDFREEILRGPLRSYTPNTKRDPEGLRAEFAAIRQAGFAECVEEIEVGVSSVAAPIRIGNIGATFSVGATGPVRRFNADRRAQIGRELCLLSGKVAAWRCKCMMQGSPVRHPLDQVPDTGSGHHHHRGVNMDISGS